ncbi:hypothetical protein MKX03_026181 [Papaver bracteatum]|nr:hypothetical protein MKX03_026181 [Papaver bracteatum]
MEKMADTGHQMLQQRIKDATNFQYMNGDCFPGTTLLMIHGVCRLMLGSSENDIDPLEPIRQY